MRRRDLLLAAAAPLLPTPPLAQTPERVWRVGVLTPNQFGARTIRQLNLPELAKLGFVEGRNLSYQVFSADEVYERLPALAVELVATKPDAIIAVGPGAIRAARAATSTIPIVMSYGGEDPIAAGWAQSYARPGGNITGVVLLSPELDGKRLHLLHDTFGARRRIAVLFHNRSRNTPTDRAVQAVAKKAGLDLLSFYTSGTTGVRGHLQRDPRVWRGCPADCVLFDFRKRCCQSCGVGAESWGADHLRVARHGRQRLSDRLWRDRAELQRRTADFVARILRGTPAGEVPIEDPTTFELALNLKTAKALGIGIPSQLLALADEVIE